MKYAWTCGCCGKAFDVLPMDYAPRAPANWFGIPERERDARAKLSDDFCIIDGSELEPTTYPLAIEQRQGISLERVKEIAARSGHVHQQQV